MAKTNERTNDRAGVGTFNERGRYVPARPAPKAGEPPVVERESSLPDAEPLPGEPTYWG